MIHDIQLYHSCRKIFPSHATTHIGPVVPLRTTIGGGGGCQKDGLTDSSSSNVMGERSVDREQGISGRVLHSRALIAITVGTTAGVPPAGDDARAAAGARAAAIAAAGRDHRSAWGEG
jgi:hypothetical protein